MSSKYVFVGWPLEEAQRELLQRSVSLKSVVEASVPAKDKKNGIPYVIQEHWNSDGSVCFTVGMRMSNID